MLEWFIIKNIRILKLDFAKKDPIDTNRMTDLTKGFLNLKNVTTIFLNHIYYDSNGASFKNLHNSIREACLEIDKKNGIAA